KGWVACDGAQLNREQHKALSDVIGTAWGSEDSQTFRVPDLRGMFLRGWQNSKDATQPGDHDAEKRGRMYNGGATGNHVGTYEGQGVQSYRHAITLAGHWGDKHGDDIGWGADNGNYPDSSVAKGTSDAGVEETRPQNVAVLFCIRD